LSRWAAKEAAIKALRPERRTFWEIMILAERSGLPYALILDRPQLAKRDHGLKTQEKENVVADGVHLVNQNTSSNSIPDQSPQDLCLDPDQFEGQVARLSISHDGDFATAVCMAVQDSSTSNLQ
jgi:holo-[acyl-carrier protein] synthase